MDFEQFLEDAFIQQQKYDSASGIKGPLDMWSDEERYVRVITYLGHMIEEVVETRMLVPRRTWKKNEKSYLETKEGKKEFCKEMTDILLFFRATIAYSGISVSEFMEAFNDKLDYNQVRDDHKRN
jgi:hypothetical protein